MAIFVRCAAPLHLYDIAIFDIFSRITTDDGRTTQEKPLRHITPSQENIETAEDSPRGRGAFAFLNVIKLVICAVAVIPTSKKMSSEERPGRSRDAPFCSSVCENEMKKREN